MNPYSSHIAENAWTLENCSKNRFTWALHIPLNELVSNKHAAQRNKRMGWSPRLEKFKTGKSESPTSQRLIKTKHFVESALLFP